MLGLLRFSADGTKCEIQYYSPYHDATYHPSNLEMLSLSLTAKPCDHPTTEPRDEIPATATQNGYTAGVWCTACKTYVEGGEVIPATGLLGDVDGNGAVNSTDARLTLQYAVQKIDGEGLELGAADVDGSGAVNSTDARLILQYAVQKIDKLPAA